MSNNIKKNSKNSINTPSSFSFKYVESGGLANNYLVISFDSETNNLKVSTDVSGADLTQKSIDDSEKTDLMDTVTKNNFFNTKATYVTEKENEDNSAISSSLTVTIDTDIHTAVWTNNSKEIPSELVEITNEIKKIAHGKKMI